MDQAQKDKKQTSLFKKTLTVYWRATRLNRHDTIQSLLLPVGILFRSVLAPFAASLVIASLVGNNGRTADYFVLLVVTSVAGVLLELFGVRALMRISANAQAWLRDQAFQALLRRSTSFFANRVSGRLIAEVNDYINSYSLLLNAGYINGLGLLIIIVVGLAIVAINAWQLGLLLFVIGAITALLTKRDMKRREVLRNKRLEAQKKSVAHFADSITNAQTVKTFSQEQAELTRSFKLERHLADMRVTDWVRTTTNANLRNGLVIATQLGVILLLIITVRHDPRTLATGIFAFTYTLTVSSRFFELNTISRQLDEAFLQAEPIIKLLGEEPEIIDQAGSSKLTLTEGVIAFTHVDFAYADSPDLPVLQNFSLAIAGGEKVGLMGPSGGGKSTITKLLLRFEDIQDGAITYDKQDIRNVTQASLRENVAYVPQEPLLFHRSIKENIAYGKLDATYEQIVQAAKQAFADEFIRALPSGYDTVVGERGVKLSGGQRQRIAIARAILKDAPVLILDEATSALDSASEQYIQRALTELMEGRTAIVIAHRLSTIQHMDRIIVLDKGNVIEEGSHKKLVSQGGTYADLWQRQSGGFIEE